jgi:glycine/D-amino acid oxidase-like deaminating enzyme
LTDKSTQNMKKVIVLGGGVAGMSAAHELIERGFEVEVYERNQITWVARPEV